MSVPGLVPDDVFFEHLSHRRFPAGNFIRAADSLDYIDLVVVIENNFSFKVKPEDFTGILTFQDFYDYIISKVNPTNAN